MAAKQTPLYKKHIEHGGKIVEFGGWELPVQYTSIIDEHNAVRCKAGLFDVSHMGEILVEGEGALAFLNNVCTNDFTSMLVGKCRYSPMCYEDGGTADDLLIYKKSDTCYMVVVNAANIQSDYAHLSKYSGGVTLKNVSDITAMLALQGPAYREVLARLDITGELPQKFYSFNEGIRINGIDCLVSTTGYTGEPGVEIYCAGDDAPKLFEQVYDAGKPVGMLLCGLGARDTLRFECAMPLYGHELSAKITPLECGLGSFVKLDKQFVGRDALQSKTRERVRIGLELLDRGIAREGCKVFADGTEIGTVTSGMPSPTLGKNLAMAMVSAEAAQVDGATAIEVRGKMLAARQVCLPFYKSQHN